MQGFGSRQWLYETGSVYLLWGFLNYLIFFGLIYFIIPNGLHSRQYVKMIVLTYLLVLTVGLFKYYAVSQDRFEYVRVSYYKDEEGKIPVYFTFYQYMLKTLFTGTFVSILAYGWGLTANWFQGEKIRKELENKRLAAELSFLRMQINPHFLFNSLNSIYSLSLKKSDFAPQAILKLSDMMRYLLYEREDASHMVALHKEIEYLENYIALQKIRFNHGQHIEFLTEGDDSNQKIAPLLLIPFIENAFKHGLLTDSANPMKIYLLIEGKRLILQVKNRKNLNNKDSNEGIGLENVNKRLKLLYPGKHQLTITESEEHYQSDLVLFL